MQAGVNLDFERRRQVRETANELACSRIMVGFLTLLLASETMWSVCADAGLVRDKQDFEIAAPVRWATAAMLVFHVGLLVYLRFEPRYFPARKYVIVVMRMALMGGACWAEWYNPLPDVGLIIPMGGFKVMILLAGLSYSRRAVLLAGILACFVYATMAILGPDRPLNIRAASAATLMFTSVTFLTWRIVSTMLEMTAETVSSERLSRFFSPEVANLIATEPEIAIRAAECNVTVMFSDISGFTAMASRMRPQDVVNLLNDYFPRMVEIVFRHGGTLEKFVGDALLAVWGAPLGRPDDANRAVAAAIEMQAAVQAFNAARVPAGCEPIAVHVGIASGMAAAGYIGTDRYIQYAVIGDTTNVASRICSAAGAGEILIGESTRCRLSAGDFHLEPLPPVPAKGKDRPVPVHLVRAAAAADA